MKRLITLSVVMILAGEAATVRAQGGSPDTLLERARHTAVIEGNPRQAIEQYTRIAIQFRNTPAVAALALYRRGQLEETLRLPAARATYDLLLTQYAGVPRYADAARARLVAKGWVPRQAGVQTRLLWDKAVDTWGTTTADGRYLSFPDWETGELGIRDLVAGSSRRVTNNGGYASKGEVEGTAISPSGNLIAFGWQRWDAAAKTEGGYQLRVVSGSGSGEHVVISGKDVNYADPQSWSPDEKWIATNVHYESLPGGGKIVLVAADGSQTRTLLTLTDRRPRKSAFSPDGQWLAYCAAPQAGSLASDAPGRDVFVIPTATSASAPAIKVAANAMLVGWTPDGSGLLFTRERNDANELWLQPMAGGQLNGEPTKITSVSDVGTALSVTSQGALIFGKTRRVTDAVVAQVDPATGTLGSMQTIMPVAAWGLGGTSGAPRYSPDGKYLLLGNTTNTLVIRSLADTIDRKVAPQMATIGRVEWAADSSALLISGSTTGGAVGVHRVDAVTGAATLLFPASGMMLFTQSRDGSVLYYRTQGGPVMARDLGTGAERTILSVEGNVQDLRLSRDGTRLAVVGLTSLRIVDLQTGNARVRFAHNEDVFDKFWGGDWSPDGRRFMTMVSIGATGNGPFELWNLSEDGGDPVRQRLPAGFRGFRMNAGGTEFATMKWENEQQVWTVENFLPTAPSGNLR